MLKSINSVLVLNPVDCTNFHLDNMYRAKRKNASVYKNSVIGLLASVSNSVKDEFSYSKCFIFKVDPGTQ